VIGATAAAKADADGSTLLLGYTSELVISPRLVKGVTYATERDFKPVAFAGSTPLLLIAGKGVPGANLEEFLAAAKHELAPGDAVQRKGWSVRVAEVNHFAPHLTSYGYRLDSPEGSIVYSGDTGPSRQLAELAQDCDVLVHMCHYLTGTAPSKTFSTFTMGHWNSPGLPRRPGRATWSSPTSRSNSTAPACGNR
jgi:hypothetical protein